MVKYNTNEQPDGSGSRAQMSLIDGKDQEDKDMKSLRMVLMVGLMSFTALAYGQSDAQKSFDKLKALAGSWEGTLEGHPLQVSLRVTSRGNALMHEMTGPGSPDDPITMLHMDGDRLLLTHYCDAGNQPRMVATVSPDGKTITFNFVEATNLLSSQMGHMQRVVFDLIDADHHTEKWEFATASGKQMGGLLDLKRTK
jgi:hypothetical protein